MPAIKTPSTDWLIEAYRRTGNTSDWTQPTTSISQSYTDCDSDGGAYGGGRSDYTVWK